MERIIDGYRFSTDEDALMAKEELQRVNYISEKLNEDDPKSILLVYNKSITSGIFTTPVGIDFLKTIREYLIKNPSINNEEVADIQIRYSISDALFIKQNKRYESLNVTEKSYKKPFSYSVILNIILIILIAAMFVVAIKADNPNMLNYKTAVLNEYSEWEQELTQRENAVREKESELGITP